MKKDKMGRPRKEIRKIVVVTKVFPSEKKMLVEWSKTNGLSLAASIRYLFLKRINDEKVDTE